jgi:hypothetical protein
MTEMTTLQALQKMHSDMSDMLESFEGVLTDEQSVELSATIVMLDNARREVGNKINHLIDFGTVE